LTAAGRKAPGRAQNLIKNSLLFFSGCIFDAAGAKSAFALLSAKVTKPERGNLALCRYPALI